MSPVWTMATWRPNWEGLRTYSGSRASTHSPMGPGDPLLVGGPATMGDEATNAILGGWCQQRDMSNGEGCPREEGVVTMRWNGVRGFNHLTEPISNTRGSSRLHLKLASVQLMKSNLKGGPQIPTDWDTKRAARVGRTEAPTRTRPRKSCSWRAPWASASNTATVRHVAGFETSGGTVPRLPPCRGTTPGGGGRGGRPADPNTHLNPGLSYSQACLMFNTPGGIGLLDNTQP